LCINRWPERRMFLVCSCHRGASFQMSLIWSRDGPHVAPTVLRRLSLTLFPLPQNLGNRRERRRQGKVGACRTLPSSVSGCRGWTISVERHINQHQLISLRPCCGSLEARGDRPPVLDPGRSVGGVQWIASPGVPCHPAGKPSPLQHSGREVGEEIDLVDPDPPTAEVIRLEGADPHPAADLLDRHAGRTGGLLKVEEPANSGPAGAVLLLEPVPHPRLPGI
jgi:hypothetical protein